MPDSCAKYSSSQIAQEGVIVPVLLKKRMNKAQSAERSLSWVGFNPGLPVSKVKTCLPQKSFWEVGADASVSSPASRRPSAPGDISHALSSFHPAWQLAWTGSVALALQPGCTSPTPIVCSKGVRFSKPIVAHLLFGLSCLPGRSTSSHLWPEGCLPSLAAICQKIPSPVQLLRKHKPWHLWRQDQFVIPTTTEDESWIIT